MIFLDTNIVIELLSDDEDLALGWSRARFAVLAGDQRLSCNLIVVAEVAAGVGEPARLSDNLSAMSIDVIDLDVATALRAAEAYRTYRARGGARSTILPDFLIAAHAATLGATLMTRDRRLATYFPDLTLTTPETHP